MAVKLVLKGRPKDDDPKNGLSALGPRMRDNTAVQYVLLRVQPVDDTVRRGDNVALTTVEIRAIEPLVDDDHVRQVATLIEEATRRRLKREKQAAPGQDTLDLGGEDSEDSDKASETVDEDGSRW